MPTHGGRSIPRTPGRGLAAAAFMSALVLLASGLAGRCRAEVNVGDSIEWRVADADLVVRCKLVDAADDGRDEVNRWQRLTFDVYETIKGPPADRLTVRRRTPVTSPWEDDPPAGECLMFLVRSTRTD